MEVELHVVDLQVMRRVAAVSEIDQQFGAPIGILETTPVFRVLF
ncbi:hypothetical protein ABAC402_01285 [Asticcacaulis sp. AC402]|nr:hypothetical protein ABAC402_01285 [Asticcacaulis sp. AC402]